MKQDARLRELLLLKRVDETSELTYETSDALERQMVHSLILTGVLNSEDTLPTNEAGKLTVAYASDVNMQTVRLLGGARAQLRIGHPGRVRMSELEATLRSERTRDPTGLMTEQMRHLEQDLWIVLSTASIAEPLAILAFDMNGMKAINTRYSWAEGTSAIEMYLRAILRVLPSEAEPYRPASGDEVTVVLRGTRRDAAEKVAIAALTSIASERYDVVQLGACCGVAMIVDPKTPPKSAIAAAQEAEARAKAMCKKEPNALCVLLFNGETAPRVVTR